MIVVSSLNDAALDRPAIVSIGNFDGLHLGHQAILQAVVQRAAKDGVRSAVITFDPHPIRFLAPDRAPQLISTLGQKTELIRQAGVDLLFVARFDSAFANLSPENFVQNYLVRGLQAKCICVGADFSFGHRQSGTVATLRQFWSNFDLVEVPSVRVRGITASSSVIRRLVAEGAMPQAGRLLGRWLEIEGTIESGAGIGKRMTVPTLNVAPDNELLPDQGVYITRISLDGGVYMDSLTNIGVRPTFNGDRLTVETYVLGNHVPEGSARARLQFLHRVRHERRFDSPAALREQIQCDAAKALRFFRILRTAGHARSHSS